MYLCVVDIHLATASLLLDCLLPLHALQSHRLACGPTVNTGVDLAVAVRPRGDLAETLHIRVAGPASSRVPEALVPAMLSSVLPACAA